MKRFIRRRLPLIFLFFLIVAGIALGFFYKSDLSYKNPELVAESESRTLAEAVGKLIVLPTDELPTIATVSDPEALKDQVFFAEAKRGDKVLIFTNAKKAILYDPVANKIVNVAPVNVGDPQNKSELMAPGSVSGAPLKENEF
jgi:hypothetical protein